MQPLSTIAETDVAAALMRSPESQAGAVLDWIAQSERWVDDQCVNLYAGTNIQSPTVRAAMRTTLDSRPSLGDPGDKYETGLGWADRVELLANAAMRRLFAAQRAELRVGSGSLANLYGFMATCHPGDSIYALPERAAGHATHHQQGAAGLYGLATHDIPLTADGFGIDLGQLEDCLQRDRPPLVVLGASLVLAPYPIAEVAAMAHAVGARLMFDAAHMSGLIAGKAFQNPLQFGADFVTMSTYKSFGGPAGGAILTNDPNLYERFRRIAYPGLTANFDLARLSGLAVAALELQAHGETYAAQCVANAQSLARALAARGLPVYQPVPTYTETSHLALDARPFGGGTTAARRAESANILFSGIPLPFTTIGDTGDYNGIRFGTQEITRWGFAPGDMEWLAEMVAQALQHPERAESIRAEVVETRRRFATLRYVFPAPEPK